jgi:transcriptional regulator with XRE-family HTH domain
MPALAKAIGANIRGFRKQRGLTQEGLAEMADLDFTTIGAAERGVRNLSVESLYRGAKSLGVSLNDLLEPPKRRLTSKDEALNKLVSTVRPTSEENIRLLTSIARLIEDGPRK